MNNPALDEIQRRFPVGDYIEYETTGRGFFSGEIIGYQIDTHGIALDLGDRRFTVSDAKWFKSAEKYHRAAHDRTIIIPTPVIEQLTLF